jgi:carboxylesterase type B
MRRKRQGDYSNQCDGDNNNSFHYYYYYYYYYGLLKNHTSLTQSLRRLFKISTLLLLVSILTVDKLGPQTITFFVRATLDHEEIIDLDNQECLLVTEEHERILEQDNAQFYSNRIQRGGGGDNFGGGKEEDPLYFQKQSMRSKNGGGGGGYSSSSSSKRRKKTKSKRPPKDSSSSSSSLSSLKSTSASTGASSDATIISTKVTVSIPGYGKAEGRREQGVDMWKGIPYAAPPVGSLRFAPPEAVAPWAPSKLDASMYAPDCYQLIDPILNPLADENYMSEDCLYLNVFTPAGHVARSRQGKFLSGAKKLPVMLWLHGGAFQQGGARRPEYDGRKLAERDIIVVTLNYRLGALGFLVSSPDGLYGNFGLMDQRAALDWVKKNIEAFGGDPDNITLFGESAGAVMIGLHLLMEGAGTLFHKAIMQSNPLGYTFRSVIVADFIGEALKRNVDCRDLACLRAERVEEIMRAQSSLMGVPRSVGDFFTFGPTLTAQRKLKLSLTGESRFFSRSEENRLPRLDTDESHNSYVSEWRVGTEVSTDTTRWSGVNVSQPLKMLDKIPDNIPIIIGTNQHEGEMFVHSAFPAPMPKPVYWMFVGALFRDSASRVLRHYRGLVDEIERQAEELALRQMEEEENKQNYLENKETLDREYEILLAMNKTRTRNNDMNVVGSEGIRTLVKTWSTGGGFMDQYNRTSQRGLSMIGRQRTVLRDKIVEFAKSREEKRILRQKEKALKEAKKVVLDYRPVMSAIIGDYLFRCPSWHFAQLLTRNRSHRGKHENNVFVYRFSLPTHIPGYKECWGKSCHTAELPYVFQSMDVIRSNYSTLGPHAQKEAPSAPEYPYTQIMAAYRGVLEAVQLDDHDMDMNDDTHLSHANGSGRSINHTKAFQRILSHFFGDYFKEDADEEMATDMSERWASFARNSNPNYDGSKAEWLPWRHKSENSTFFHNVPQEDDDVTAFADADDKNYWSDEHFDYWSDEDYDEFSETEDEMSASTTRYDYYRRRALEAMEMDVAAEDVFTTELRRVQYRKDVEEEDTSFLRQKVLKRWGFAADDHSRVKLMSKKQAREAIRLAQELGLMGTGLSEDETGKIGMPYSNEIFFPELLELTWPPEGRLIERDCTCDMWDRIRCK